MSETASHPALALAAAVEALAGQVPVELPGPVALADTALVLRQLDRLKAVVLRQLADVAARELHALDDATSVGAWVDAQSVGADRTLVTLAGRLHRVPAVEQAVVDGRVSSSAGAAVARACEKVRRHVDRPYGLVDGDDGEAVVHAVVTDGVLMCLAESAGGLADDDPALAALQKQLTGLAGSPVSQADRLERAFVVLAEHTHRSGHLPEALDRLVAAVLPQQLEDAAERSHDARGLTVRRDSAGTGWDVRGHLDLECGELLHTVLTAARATEPDGPADTAAWAAQREDACRPVGPAPRSRRQQDHDALALVLHAHLDAGLLGSRGKAVPHLLVTVPITALQGHPGALPAVAASGAVLPGSLVHRLLCDSRLTRVVLGLGRRIVETSHSQRTLKAHERHALHVRWGGRCAEAGCTSPPGTPLVPHHGTPWQSTGTTALDDHVAFCERTHHDLHTRGRLIRLRDGRLLGPNGWTTKAVA